MNFIESVTAFIMEHDCWIVNEEKNYVMHWIKYSFFLMYWAKIQISQVSENIVVI